VQGVEDLGAVFVGWATHRAGRTIPSARGVFFLVRRRITMKIKTSIKAGVTSPRDPQLPAQGS